MEAVPDGKRRGILATVKDGPFRAGMGLRDILKCRFRKPSSLEKPSARP